MKLANLISNCHQTFASALLAFSLFGFVFPHHATKMKGTHQVNLKASGQTWQTKTDDPDPQYKWFY